MKRTCKTIVLCCFVICFIKANAQTTQVYNWKSVAIKGGGYIPAFIYSHVAPNLLYARTDMGGAYRWNASKRIWISLTDAFTNSTALGILSLAADPLDSNKVYMATGLYTKSWDPTGVLYISSNKGTTWQTVSLPCKIGGNEAGRGTGERLQIDPNANNILFLGSQNEGLFKSVDFGATWNKVTSFPKNNIAFVEFDKSTGTKGKATPVLYVSTYDNLAINDTTKGGMYTSSDSGKTWSYLANQPVKILPKSWFSNTNPSVPKKISQVNIANHMIIIGDTIYVTYGGDLAPGCLNGMLYKWNKKTLVWKEMFPASHDAQGGYSGISVHPTKPNVIVVSSLGIWYPTKDQIYLTSNGGASWTNLCNTLIYDNAKAPYAGTFSWVTDVQIDPFNGNNALLGTGAGLFMTNNLEQALIAKPTTWSFECDSLEETVPIDIISPTSGAPLISGLGDVKGFRHLDLTVAPANTFNGSGNTASLDFAALNPNKIVRTHNGGNASFSNDQGQTWTLFPATPTGLTGIGHIAVSANGNTIVWAPGGAAMSYSTDNGSSWTTCVGQPNYLTPLSDRVNSSVFYVIQATTGNLFKSTDAAKNFIATPATLPTVTSTVNAVCVFGKEGDIWIANQTFGLYHTTDGGATIAKISTVVSANWVAVGKSATSTGYPALYINGTISGQSASALFRSDDQGQSWKRINTNYQLWGNGYSSMTADPRIYGRLYVGVGGRGIMYGDIAGDGSCVMPNVGSDFTLCNTATATLSSNIADTSYSYVWTKDAVTLSSTTKNLIVGNAGKYRVYALKTGCPVSYDDVTVSSNLISVANDSVCPATKATLTAFGTGVFNWFSSSVGGSSLGTGNQYTTSPTVTTNYYVQNSFTTAYSIGIPAYTSGGWTLGNAFNNNQNRMQMTVLAPLWLKSIAMQITGNGTKAVIRITDASGTIIAADSASGLSTGKYAIPFSVILQAGTYYIDAVGTTGSVQFQTDRTGAVFTLPGYVTLAPMAGWAWGIFFDLQFEIGNACARTPVVAVVKTNCLVLPITQTIALKKGWNIISINVHPTDSSISTLFKGLDIQEIKTMDAFWRKGQNLAFNSLQNLEVGYGYLVYSNIASQLTLMGSNKATALPLLKTGWQLIGCPWQNSTALSSIFNPSTIKSVKNFTGFWIPNAVANSISSLDPGDGYFIKK